MKSAILLLLTLALPAVALDIKAPKVAPALPDAAELLPASDVHVEGWLGQRILANATNRLLTVDTEPFLAGFRSKPGSHPWIGEHVGKWMHAATLAWASTGDARLRAKLDSVAAELIKAQEPDGYLGTYVPGKRFGLYPEADWDVWSHKYNLIGLLTYYEYTGNETALSCCRKMGDLLLATFGPGKKSILSAGTHVGMAATSVLEPMVLLYRHTGDKKYLEFCQYILKSWDEEGGPRIIAALLSEKQVNKTANRKAYEMLSNLVGILELARATGDRQLLTPVLNAWQDIASKRLYITGSASQAEHFGEDHQLPNGASAHVAETCVTTTWIQLNQQLLRLTGDARFGNELEKTFYNHLAAAQRPRGDDWCYFTPLEGKKPYDAGITCCHSSGPRGMALAGQQAYLISPRPGRECVFVNTLESSSARFNLGGTAVQVKQQSGFPNTGNSTIKFDLSRAASFTFALRVPTWSPRLTAKLNGDAVPTESRNGWLVIPSREWKSGDTLDVEFTLRPEFVNGTHGNNGLMALRYGPFVLAYDSKANPSMPLPALVGFATDSASRGGSAGLQVSADVRSPRLKAQQQAVFVPFADAGADGGTYRVWLPSPNTPLKDNASLLAGGHESFSRRGNVEGSIADGDPGTFAVTFNTRKADEDWYAITFDEPISIRRIVYTHGKTFHDGGWFDASKRKPRIQVQQAKGAAWQDAGELTEYPATTATDTAGLGEGGRQFTLKLDKAMPVLGVRVIGTPACGDNPQQSFSSCGELEAFAD